MTLWFSVEWKNQIKKGKPKKVSPELLKQAVQNQTELSKQEKAKIEELESRMNAMKNLRPETDYDK